MLRCVVEYKNEEYKSVEEAFQHQKAICCGDEKGAERVLRATDAYRAKAEGGGITTTPEWDQKEEATMLNLLRAKFSRNQKQCKALLNTGEKILVEFTQDKKSGCGMPLSKISEAKVDNLPGRNLLGKMLCQVRGELKQE